MRDDSGRITLTNRMLPAEDYIDFLSQHNGELPAIIEEVVKHSFEVSKEEVVAFYLYRTEFECFTTYKSN